MAARKNKAVKIMPETIEECVTLMKMHTLSVNFPYNLDFTCQELEIGGLNVNKVYGFLPKTLFKELFLHPEINSEICLAKGCCFHPSMFIKGSVFQEQVVERNTENVLVWKHTGSPLDDDDAHDPRNYFEYGKKMLNKANEWRTHDKS